MFALLLPSDEVLTVHPEPVEGRAGFDKLSPNGNFTIHQVVSINIKKQIAICIRNCAKPYDFREPQLAGLVVVESQ
jgi:hypothetical protein